jgi:hypothetical protein
MQYAKLIAVIGPFFGVDQHLAFSRADGKRSNFKTQIHSSDYQTVGRV